MKRHSINIFAAVALLLPLLVSCGTPQPSAPTAPAASPGASASQDSGAVPTPRLKSFGTFTAEGLDGEEYSEAIFGDAELTMINIWATFCGPCLQEMPDLGIIAEEYAGKGLQVIGIVADVQDSQGNVLNDQVQLAKDIVEETGANYLHLMPSQDLIDIKLKNVSAVPETVFVDKNGNIVGQRHVGAQDKEGWVSVIESYFAFANEAKQ